MEVMIPKQRLWYLKLWILNLSLRSLILRHFSLEINLIKENKPKYNIMLKDDKSYPFIKITNERYPRLSITRQVKKDGGLYFGPYPDVGAANEIKRLLDRIFPFVSVPIRRLRSVFITISTSVWPILSVRRMRPISSPWPRKFLIF